MLHVFDDMVSSPLGTKYCVIRDLWRVISFYNYPGGSVRGESHLINNYNIEAMFENRM